MAPSAGLGVKADCGSGRKGLDLGKTLVISPTRNQSKLILSVFRPLTPTIHDDRTTNAAGATFCGVFLLASQLLGTTALRVMSFRPEEPPSARFSGSLSPPTDP
jgi:hypothetical protein